MAVEGVGEGGEDGQDRVRLGGGHRRTGTQCCSSGTSLDSRIVRTRDAGEDASASVFPATANPTKNIHLDTNRNIYI